MEPRNVPQMNSPQTPQAILRKAERAKIHGSTLLHRYMNYLVHVPFFFGQGSPYSSAIRFYNQGPNFGKSWSTTNNTQFVFFFNTLAPRRMCFFSQRGPSWLL